MTLDFSRNYSPPGVYIEEDETTLVSATGIPPTLVALCGPARGYQVNTEQIVLSDEAVRLSKQGVDTDTATVTVATTGVAVDPTDYSLTKVGTVGDNTYYTDVLIAADPEVADGTVVFVSYRYTSPTYYDPKRFESFEDVKDIYGEPLNTAVQSLGDTAYQFVLSPLALACMVAFQNGATEVITCAATPPPGSATTDSAKSTARRTALLAAYTKLESLPSVTVLVGITDGIADADSPGALVDIRSSVNNAGQDGNYRFGVIGFDPAVDTEIDELLATSGVTDRRIMLAYATPSGLLMYSGGANATFAVGHQYLAAAYAGRMAALPVQQAITKQVISGFSGLAGTPLANSLKNQYASAGIALSEINRLGQLAVRHGVTTDVTNINTREAGVVRGKDTLVVTLQDGMTNSGLIGTPIDTDTLLSVKSAVQGILEQAQAAGVVVSYNDLAVRQTSVDPSVVEVKFAYKPAYPLNYIVISFSIDMSTGVSDLTDTDTTATTG